MLPVERGERTVGSSVKVGYFAQYRVDMLTERNTVLQETQDTPFPVNEQTARSILGSFLFRGDDAFKPVAVLSGGEKSRLALVKLLLDPPNLLLMDEPTTHLDMASIDALIGALDQYEGTLIFISHDVHFIKQLARKVLHIDSGKLTPYAGGYDYYLEKSQATNEREALVAANAPTTLNGYGHHGTNGHATAMAPTVSAPAIQRKTKEQKRAEAEARNAVSREKRDREARVRELEREISRLEARQRAITAEMEEEATYQQPGKPMELNRELTAVSELLARTTHEWESTAEQLQNESPVAAAE